MLNGYGICLNEWLEDESIKTELRLLIKISSLTAEKGFCYASNSFFAEYFNTSEVTISKQIKKLEKLNYIEIIYKKRGAEVIKRFIRLKKTLTDDYQKLKPTIKENFKENITSNNITSNNKESNVNKIAVVSQSKLDAEIVAKYLYDKILTIQPDCKSNYNTWVKEIELAIRIDGRKKEHLIRCIDWIYSVGTFWIPNIMSGKKLREKYDQLEIQAKSTKKVMACNIPDKNIFDLIEERAKDE